MSVAIDGHQLVPGQYHRCPKALTVPGNMLPPAAAQPGAPFQVATRVLLCPRSNTHLEVRWSGRTGGSAAACSAQEACCRCVADVFIRRRHLHGVDRSCRAPLLPWQGLFVTGGLLVTDNEPEGFRWGRG